MLNIHKLKKNINNNIINKDGYMVKESMHNPSNTKEWFNSIYSYYKNNQKHIPNTDITVIKLINSYFNMFNFKLEKSILARRRSIRRRILILNKVLIGKPEFKHTNDKLIITLYIYNRELSHLLIKLKNLKRKMLAQYFLRLIVKNLNTFKKLNIIKNILKKIDIFKKQILKLKKRNVYLAKYFKKSKKFNIRFISFNKLKKLNLRFKSYMTKLKKAWNYFKVVKERLNNKRNISLAKSLKRFEYRIERGYNNRTSRVLMSILYMINNKINISNNIEKSLDKIPKFKLDKLMYLDTLKKLLVIMRLYIRYNRIIQFNKSKFNINIYLLRVFLEKIYKKEVEFNIISLKNFHLDSNILTQVIAIKLKNRKNRLLRIVRKVLAKVRLPLTRRLEYYNVVKKNENLQNIIIRKYANKKYFNMLPIFNKNSINKMEIKPKFYNIKESGKDKLDLILNNLHPINYTINGKNISKRSLENTVLDTIKNKTITGVRIEASGRLSKRIIASKAIFKMRQKGTIKNINSSYKKLSSVLLRGNTKANLQLSKLNNKTRIGAFGIKGWISSI